MAPAAGRLEDDLQPVDYGLPEAALRKWAAADLHCRRAVDGRVHCEFRYACSTCTQGGAEFAALLRAELVAEGSRVVVARAWIDVPPGDLDAARCMCACRRGDLALSPGPALTAAFCGSPLEDALTGLNATNPAGCLCEPSKRDHKWRGALATIHYALSHGLVPAAPDETPA